MVREEFLVGAIKQNLFGLRAIRDIAAILQTGLKTGGIGTMLKLERVKILSESALERITILSRGYFSGYKHDNEFLTESTKNCELLTAMLGADIDSKITEQCAQFFKANNTVPVGERGTIFNECVQISLNATSYADTLAKLIQDIIIRQNHGKSLCFSESLLVGFGQIVSDYAVVSAHIAKKEDSRMLSREELQLKFKAILSESVDYGNTSVRNWLAANIVDSCLVFKRLADAAAGGVLKGILPPLAYDLCYRYCLLGENV